ncbi:autotransporter-associated beta strand repeat-containing protein [Catenulispora rubra]|uniref:autotransporter-associated beta strand repeat-containing protein n=1 Tax=Catenulispora rubra TaxID=280293 RepID=UPI00189266FB|nr:autotransporter-associated beta strand repeat-containing protein [Catenulispora rubra]
MFLHGRVLARMWAAMALTAAMLSPAGPARAAVRVDITGQVLAGQDIALHGDSIVNLPSGTTTYNGVLSGQGTLTITGSGTLILTRDSSLTLLASLQQQSVATSGGNWPYPIVADPDPPTVVVERGATLQYGNGGATGVIGHYPYSLPKISLALNQDNIQVDGTLVLDLSGPDVNLGTISGSGLVYQPRSAWARLNLAGTQPFRGVIGVGTAIGFGDASYRIALPNARAILNDGSAIFYARDYTLTIPQDFYEQNYGTDINYHTWQAGKIVMTGVDNYSDTGTNSDPALSDPSLNTRQVGHTVNFRGINIEGATVQWGDGTTHRFFLPATPYNSYINIHNNGSLTFDYNGPVTLDSPISGGVYHDSLKTPASAAVTLSPTAGNAVTFATPQNYHGTTTIGSGATLLLGTGTAGGDSSLLTGTAVDAIVDAGALVARNTTTPLSLSNITGAGSLTQSGAARTTLTGTTAYTGATTVTSGTLALGPGSSGIGSSSGLTLNGGTFDISAVADQTVMNLAGSSGTVVLGPHTLTVTDAASTTYGGKITGSGGLDKSGAGALTLTGATTTGGAWRIDQGTLAVDGAPITTGGLTEAASATLMVTPNASGAALNVNGPLNLSGALAVKPAGAAIAGERFTLVHSTGPGTVGAFAGLAEGATFAAGRVTFQITYHGGSGHDIVLTVQSGASTSAGAPDTGSASTETRGGGLASPHAAAGAGGGSSLRLVALVAVAPAALLAGFVVLRARRRPAARGTQRRGARRGGQR